ncbi:MAG: GIY-YIG nuclease family protein [Thaumarchaeota archaeon]|nr:GIY-YIG nuclease family protein [Nitrososphaerota archaeon]
MRRLQGKEPLTAVRGFDDRLNFHLKGVYILLFRITKDFSKHVGSLGKIQFEKGNYAYLGSAQSSVLARLERHFAKRKKMHWHIDYLTTSTNIKVKRAIYSLASSKDFECRLSKEFAGLTFSKAIHSFGSSDCKHGCGSHLFILKSNEDTVRRSTIQILRKFHLRPVEYHPEHCQRQ